MQELIIFLEKEKDEQYNIIYYYNTLYSIVYFLYLDSSINGLSKLLQIKSQ